MLVEKLHYEDLLQPLSMQALTERNIAANVLRLDKLHPLISGNKYFKLKYYLEAAKNENKTSVATYGGAWSNHLMATAAACRELGFECFGIVRGEQPPALSHSLLQCQQLGMQLIFISRNEYKKKLLPQAINPDKTFIVPEGGYGPPGAKGAGTILTLVNEAYTHICCAIGTGTTFAGQINAASPDTKLVGINVLKGNESILGEIAYLLQPGANKNYKVINNYHFGGYAKYDSSLIQFMNEFYDKTGIPTDFVYTGKLFYGIADLIKSGYFPDQSQLLIIHSGGLKGNLSLPEGELKFAT